MCEQRMSENLPKFFEKIGMGQLENLDPESWNQAVIVFSESSFTKPYTEKQRSYLTSSDERYFHSDEYFGTSLLASCLDGTDKNIDLNRYLEIWDIEFCYLVPDDFRVEVAEP